jgi:hypothetical protein
VINMKRIFIICTTILILSTFLSACITKEAIFTASNTINPVMFGNLDRINGSGNSSSLSDESGTNTIFEEEMESHNEFLFLWFVYFYIWTSENTQDSPQQIDTSILAKTLGNLNTNVYIEKLQIHNTYLYL